jgi:hypothetical protein
MIDQPDNALGLTGTYRVSPGVAWVVELDGIILINRGSSNTLRLGYPQAAVWDLANRGLPFERIVSLLSVISALSSEQAGRLVQESFQQWQEQGFFQEVMGNG